MQAPRAFLRMPRARCGILAIMVAMWMLSGDQRKWRRRHDGRDPWRRGLGLGFLFLSITLIAFSKLNDRNRASGIGLFNAGRQLGGVMGVAGLQTLIDHNVSANLAVLGASVTAGVPGVTERLTATTAMLAALGMGRRVCRPGCHGPARQGDRGSIHSDRLRHGIQCDRSALCDRRPCAGHHQDRTLPIRPSDDGRARAAYS